jgi:hypothetical protein
MEGLIAPKTMQSFDTDDTLEDFKRFTKEYKDFVLL